LTKINSLFKKQNRFKQLYSRFPRQLAGAEGVFMSDLEQNIKRINDKLQQLLKNYQLLQKENQRQTELIASLQQTKEKDKELIGSLQEKISILKAATGKMNEADKKAFEKNISQYIREIDKCIGILSE
jgi:chromosome segregation ATPase